MMVAPETTEARSKISCLFVGINLVDNTVGTAESGHASIWVVTEPVVICVGIVEFEFIKCAWMKGESLDPHATAAHSSWVLVFVVVVATWKKTLFHDPCP
jgi:flavoprotein